MIFLKVLIQGFNEATMRKSLSVIFVYNFYWVLRVLTGHVLDVIFFF